MENKPQSMDLHRITSTAIIHKDGKYLIVKRALNKKVYPGKWSLPGGGLELSEYNDLPKVGDAWYLAIEKSLIREVKEEVGLEIEKPKYLLDLAFVRPDNIPVITLSYYCAWKSGEVDLSDQENIDYKWVSLEEAKSYDLIEGIYDEIEMVDKILKG